MEIICKGENCGEHYTELNLNKPFSLCGKCGYHNPIPKGNHAPKIVPEPTKPAASKEVGWLVVHDENASPQTYPLSMGRQVVGRKSIDRPCTIMIETNDDYMSRNHAVIEVKIGHNTGQYQYILTDNNSVNGTYVNSDTKPLRPNDAMLLNDGNVIQMGMTKVVFKSNQIVNNARQAAQTVKKQDYAPTVIVRKKS